MANYNALSIMQRRFQDEQRRKIPPLPPRRIFPQPPPTGGQPMPAPAQRRKSGSVTTGEAQRPQMGIGDLAGGAKNGMQIYQQMWGGPSMAESNAAFADPTGAIAGQGGLLGAQPGAMNLGGLYGSASPLPSSGFNLGVSPGMIDPGSLAPGAFDVSPIAAPELMAPELMNPAAAFGVAPAATGATAAAGLEAGAAGFGAESGLLAGMGGAMPWLGAGLLAAKLFGIF